MRVAIYGQSQDTGTILDFCMAHSLQADLYADPDPTCNLNDYNVVFALVDGVPAEPSKVISIRKGLAYIMGSCPESLLLRCNAVLKDAIKKITNQVCTVQCPGLSLQLFANEIKIYVKPPYKITMAMARGDLRDIIGPNLCLIDERRPNIVVIDHSLKLLDTCFENFVWMVYVVKAAKGEDYTTFLIAKGFYMVAKSTSSPQQSIWVNTRTLFQPAPSDISQLVDIVYYINLDHRTDRNTHMLRQFAEYDITNYQRVPGIVEAHGALGCSRSHVKTLETFLASNHEICIVLEDDFMFTIPKTSCTQAFSAFFQTFHAGSWDLVQLASWTLLSEPHNHVVDRCLFSLTTSGYMINRRFAKTLMCNFQESIALLESCRPHDRALYSLDVYWAKLQPVSRWYVFKPKMGTQMESYSDVINAVSHYGV
jgi:hypothetical protein